MLLLSHSHQIAAYRVAGASFSQDPERKSGRVQMCLCRVGEAIRRCHERERECVEGWGGSTKLSVPQYTIKKAGEECVHGGGRWQGEKREGMADRQAASLGCRHWASEAALRTESKVIGMPCIHNVQTHIYTKDITLI